METTKPIVVMLALVLITAVAAYSAQESPKPVAAATPAAEFSNTRTASCLVKVTADPAIITLDEFIIESLFYSSGIGGKASREVLDASPDLDPGELFEIEDLSSGGLGGYGMGGLGGMPPAPSRTPTGGLGYDEMMMEEHAGMLMDRDLAGSAGVSRSSRGRSMGPAGSGRESGASETRTRSTEAPTSTRRTRGGYNFIYGTGRLGSTSTDGGYYYYRYGPRDERGSTRRSEAPAPSASSAGQQTLLFRLSVQLPEGLKPMAAEFMDALIENFTEALDEAYDACCERLEDEIRLAQERRKEAEGQLSKLKEELGQIRSTPAIGPDPRSYTVYEQLDETVDLSVLTPSMPFSDAIEQIMNSVDPPLKVVVLWRNLLDEADIEPTTEINMNGVTAVPVGKALELLLKAVSAGAPDELDYAVDRGIITIAAAESLPQRLETRVYNIPALAHAAAGDGDLVQLIQETIEPDSWFEYGGEGSIRLYMGKKLAVVQTCEVHLKIEKLLAELLQAVPVGASDDVPADISVQMLLETRHSLLRDKQTLELDVARLEARRSAIEQQVAIVGSEVAGKVGADPVTVELQRLLELQVQFLTRTKELVEAEAVSEAALADAEEKLARAKIELAKRREDLSKSAGGDQIAKFSGELTTLTIDLAEKKAELQVISTQLNQTQKQLTAVSASDPEVSKIRFVAQAFGMAERRLNELEARLANLQEPTVTVLGADR